MKLAHPIASARHPCWSGNRKGVKRASDRTSLVWQINLGCLAYGFVDEDEFPVIGGSELFIGV